MGTRARGHACRRPESRRLLAIAAVLTVALGLAAEAQAAVRASVARGTLTVTGTPAGERVALRLASGGRLVVDVGDNGTANFTFLRSRFTRIVVRGGLGNDRLRINESNGAFTNTERTTLDGGSGIDTLIGGRYAETLSGGSGNDTVDGNAGADSVVLGAGADVLVWNPGDGSDVVQGGTGLDTLRFNGSVAAEVFAASVNGTGLRLTRNLGSVVMRAQDVETLALNALGGADTATVNDLAATDVDTVDVDLGVGGVGDGAADSVAVNGSGAVDVVQAATSGSTVQVTGLGAQIDVTQSEAANDRMTVNGLGGDDTLAGGILSAVTQLTLDGGVGNDTINGGNGADVLIGGDGNDAIDGNQGNDIGFMGAGNDTFTWDPGDGSDIVEGQGDLDTLRFNGSAGAEIFAASSNGGRLLFTRNVGNIVMDVDDVETLTVNALGGTDSATVNDLAATDVGTVNLDLGVGGVGDSAADAITVNGTVAADVMSLSGSAGTVTLASPAATIAIVDAQPANDTLTINTSSGADLVGASGLASTSVLMTVNGGANDDSLVGSQGNDTINGDAGNDFLNGGDGNDTLNGGADTDTIDGGAGIDTAVNGENVFNVP
jgi:Ca2+-binding RTX toxin-like protein